MSRLTIFIVDLLEEAVFTTSLLLFLVVVHRLYELFLVADQESVLTKVHVSIVVIRLDGFRWSHTSLEELHLEHLVLVQAHTVAIVRLRVWPRLNWPTQLDTRRTRPSENLTRVLLAITVQVNHGPALSSTEKLGELVELALDKHCVKFLLSEQMFLRLGEISHVLLVERLHHVELTAAVRQEFLIGKVICFLAFLLPQVGPDDHEEDQDVLDHLDVKLSTPVKVVEPVAIEHDDDGVDTEDVNPHETLLQVAVDFWISETGRCQFQAPERRVAQLVALPVAEDAEDVHQATGPQV